MEEFPTKNPQKLQEQEQNLLIKKVNKLAKLSLIQTEKVMHE